MVGWKPVDAISEKNDVRAMLRAWTSEMAVFGTELAVFMTETIVFAAVAAGWPGCSVWKGLSRTRLETRGCIVQKVSCCCQGRVGWDRKGKARMLGMEGFDTLPG